MLALILRHALWGAFCKGLLSLKLPLMFYCAIIVFVGDLIDNTLRQMSKIFFGEGTFSVIFFVKRRKEEYRRPAESVIKCFHSAVHCF